MRPLLAFLLILAATAVSFAESGTLIVLNKSDANASLIDLETSEVVATLPTGAGPHEAAVSPDGRICVVADYGPRGAPGNSLTVLDLAERTVVRTIDLGEYHRPHGIVWRGEHEVVVTAEEEQHLLTVNVESGEVSAAVKTDAQVSHMVAVLGDRAFVANIGSGSVTVIDLAEGSVIAQLETGAGAEGIDISPDGSELWVGNREPNTLSIIDPQSLEILAELPCADVPIRVKFTPDGRHVLVSNAASGDVAVFDSATRKEVARIGMMSEAIAEADERLFGDRFGESPVPVGILMHPEGRRAYVANTNADVISVLDLEDFSLIGRLVAGREPDGMAYSTLVLRSANQE